MNISNFTHCAVHLLLVTFFDVIVARSLISLRHDDVTSRVQSDDEVYQSPLQDAKDLLEDVQRSSNYTLDAMCTKFCPRIGRSSPYCHGNQVPVFPSHLSSTSLINSGNEESQLSSMMRVSGEYGNEVGHMMLRAQRRQRPLSCGACEQSRDTQYCQLKVLSCNINSFKLAFRKMMKARGVQRSASVTPSTSHIAIIDVEFQCQRNLQAMYTMSNNWSKMVDILKNLN